MDTEHHRFIVHTRCSQCISHPTKDTFAFFVLATLSITLVVWSIAELALRYEHLTCEQRSFFFTSITTSIVLWVKPPKPRQNEQ
jgi:hypothetical protein